MFRLHMYTEEGLKTSPHGTKRGARRRVYRTEKGGERVSAAEITKRDGEVVEAYDQGRWWKRV